MHGKQRWKARAPRAIGVAIIAALESVSAAAFQFETPDPDLKITWDNTVKYSAAWRQHDADAMLSQNINLDDGNRNFTAGQISNRFDLLSELDLAYHSVGARISAAAWNDSNYTGSNSNPGFAGGAFPNQLSTPFNRFTARTKYIHGEGSEFLDAFVYGKFDLGEKMATLRLGQHALQWGESVFFGGNAIAGGMAPVDVVKLISVPNTQFKEAIRPVPQVSGQLQITPNVSVGAYYQFAWEENRLPQVGSYFSQTDTGPDGSEQLLLAGPGSPFAFNAPRLPDQRAKDSGQGGIQLRLRSNETDYGLYLVRFHDKNFQQVTHVGVNGLVAGGPISYRMVYHEDITAVGASASRSMGDANFAVEASFRNNQDLASSHAFDASAFGAPATNNNSNPGYATGKTAHVNASVLWTLQPTALFNEASLMAEVAWNRVLKIDHNPIDARGIAVVDSNATRDAVAFRGVFTPTYRQVRPGLDLEIPIGLGFSPSGSRSMAIGPGTFPAENGGDVSIGLNGIYLDKWRFSLSYTHFFGPKNTFLNGANAFSYQQSLHDRDFIAFSLRTTF